MGAEGLGEDCPIKPEGMNLMKKYFVFLVILFVSSFCVGCGYSAKSSLPSHLKTVHVESFKNNIAFVQQGGRELYFPLLEIKVRNAVIDRFLFDGNLRVVDNDQADLILKGALIGYDRQTLRYTDNDEVQEYRVVISVSLEMFNVAKNEPEWIESGFSGETTYFVTGSLAKTEEVAIQDAITDLARRIVERTVENW